MIKTTLIALAASASLGASTTAQPTPKAPAHIEITAGPLNIIRDGGETSYSFDPASDSVLRIKIGDRKSLNIQF